MKFELETFHRDIPDQELLDDLRKAELTLRAQGRTLSFRSYNEVGKYSSATFGERFGSWNKALLSAGLRLTAEKNVSKDALFENLRAVWVHKGRQPVFRDMASLPSQYSGSLYVARFGAWRAALRAFVSFVTSDDWLTGDSIDSSESPQNKPANARTKQRTSRNISERMRFRILLRDGFECQSCGASPLKDRGIELHVDHIVPWSQGGETEGDNLQTKCKRCNLGKGNAFTR